MAPQSRSQQIHIRILMLYQDDPKKCTAARMVRFDLARVARKVAGDTILLDPFSDRLLLPEDRAHASSVTVIDCSWKRAGPVFSGGRSGLARRLPPLLAGNPVNYAKWSKLTTAEAAAAALYILGSSESARHILDKFRWGHTFLDLNRSLLDDYASAESAAHITRTLAEHGYGTS